MKCNIFDSELPRPSAEIALRVFVNICFTDINLGPALGTGKDALTVCVRIIKCAITAQSNRKPSPSLQIPFFLARMTQDFLIPKDSVQAANTRRGEEPNGLHRIFLLFPWLPLGEPLVTAPAPPTGCLARIVRERHPC